MDLVSLNKNSSPPLILRLRKTMFVFWELIPHALIGITKCSDKYTNSKIQINVGLGDAYLNEGGSQYFGQIISIFSSGPLATTQKLVT